MRCWTWWRRSARPFPQALIVQPQGPFGAGPARRWIARTNPDAESYVGLVAEAGTALAVEVRALQRDRGLSGEQTALAGFPEGAAVALEAVCADPGLAGRALLFSTRFATLPQAAPMLTTLHLLHGAADRVAPVDPARPGPWSPGRAGRRRDPGHGVERRP